MNSKCYRKIHSSSWTWYNASNDCLSRGGSLAVFTDIGRPSDNSQLTDWLNTSGTDKTYWIGLLRSWWKTTNDDNTSRSICTTVTRHGWRCSLTDDITIIYVSNECYYARNSFTLNTNRKLSCRRETARRCITTNNRQMAARQTSLKGWIQVISDLINESAVEGITAQSLQNADYTHFRCSSITSVLV